VAIPDQLSLFDPLAVPDPPRAKVPVAADGQARYGRYTLKNTRRASDECLMVCLEASKAGKLPPLPQPVSWRRQVGEQVLWLCYAHKRLQWDDDNASGRLAKQAPAASRRTSRVAS
jgi:hypothetical protein